MATVNIKKDISSPLPVDWTTSKPSEPFFQQAFYTYTVQGETTETDDHIHTYTVNKNGKGVTSIASHPTIKQINHSHKIVNWSIKNAQSTCYPNCEAQFGGKGVPLHDHKFKGKKQLKYEDRYSVVVIPLNAEGVPYTKTGGASGLRQIKIQATSEGTQKILEFYNKELLSDDVSFAEDC